MKQCLFAFFGPYFSLHNTAVMLWCGIMNSSESLWLCASAWKSPNWAWCILCIYFKLQHCDLLIESKCALSFLHFLITLTEMLMTLWEVDLFFTILLHIWIVVLLAANLYSHDHTLPDNSHSKIFNIFQDIISVQKDICCLLFFNYRYLVRDICFPSLKTPCQGFLTRTVSVLLKKKKFFFPNFVIILYMKTIKNV